MLPEIEIDGQERLLNSHAVVVGVGGLGAPASIYLAASGVGKITLVDDDYVDVSNLQRQIVHTEASVGQLKVESGAQTLSNLNSEVAIQTVPKRLELGELINLFTEADVVLDATDNASTRYSINEACLRTQTPLVSGAAIRSEGQVSVFDSRNPESPCYACLFGNQEDVELNCAENGIIAPVVGIIGTIQAMEAVKVIVAFGDVLTGYVLYVDALRMELRKLRLKRDPSCQVCGSHTKH